MKRDCDWRRGSVSELACPTVTLDEEVSSRYDILDLHTLRDAAEDG